MLLNNRVVHIGWRNHRHIYGCVVHLDIKDGKIWVQHNGTEFDISLDSDAKKCLVCKRGIVMMYKQIAPI